MISEKDLRAAAEEYEKCLLDSLPDVEEAEFKFSPGFERRMKKMIFRADHPIRFWIQKSVACFLLVIFLGGGTLFTLSPDARAAVLGWVREFRISGENEFFEYHYKGEDQMVPEGTVCRPTWVPDGYEVTTELHTIAGGTIKYEYGDEEDERDIIFDWGPGIQSTDIHVYTDNAEMRRIFINDNPADLYLERNEGIRSGILWWDQETGMMFSVAGILSEDELIKIAESVIIEGFP